MINTPDDGAIKWWIGNAAEDGKAGTVFARLKVPATDGELRVRGVRVGVRGRGVLARLTVSRLEGEFLFRLRAGLPTN